MLESLHAHNRASIQVSSSLCPDFCEGISEDGAITLGTFEEFSTHIVILFPYFQLEVSSLQSMNIASSVLCTSE